MQQSRQQLLSAFSDHPPKLEGNLELHVEAEDPDHVRLTLSSDGHEARLRATALLVPYPSGLRRLLADEPDVDAVIVDRIPRGLGTAARQAGVSYLDRRGHGRVIAPGFVYVVEPRPGSTLLPPQRSSPFAPAASRVVRALLVDPVHHWRLSDVARVTESNPGNVHRILASLVDMGLVERDDDFYVVPDPGSLLEAWADQTQPPRERYSMNIEESPFADAMRLTKDVRSPAVISGELGAELLAPYLASESAVVHITDEDDFRRVAESGRRVLPPSVAQRGRLLIDLVDTGAGQFAASVQGLRVAHPVQIYVDLYRDRGRGREAGEHLRRELIRF